MMLIPRFLTLFLVFSGLLFGKEDSYWMIQQDFIKLGKRDLYREQKKQDLLQRGAFLETQKNHLRVVGLEDLENPQYVFFMPLKDLQILQSYPSFFRLQNEKKVGQNLLDTCLNFQIFSLHEFVIEASCHFEQTFSEKRPYLFWTLYGITPGYSEFFEKHLAQCAADQKESSLSWRTWKTVLGGDSPKYLICLSFASKEEMQVKEEELFRESAFKEVIRNKKQGWAKLTPEMTYGK